MSIDVTVKEPEAGIVQFGPEDEVAVPGNLDGVLGSVPLPPCTPPPLALSFLAGKVVAFDYRDLVGSTSTPKVLPTGETICFALFPCLTYFFYFF